MATGAGEHPAVHVVRQGVETRSSPRRLEPIGLAKLFAIIQNTEVCNALGGPDYSYFPVPYTRNSLDV